MTITNTLVLTVCVPIFVAHHGVFVCMYLQALQQKWIVFPFVCVKKAADGVCALHAAHLVWKTQNEAGTHTLDR